MFFIFFGFNLKTNIFPLISGSNNVFFLSTFSSICVIRYLIINGMLNLDLYNS